MRIENLQSLLTLLETRSFTKAAEKLFITQSALSKQIAYLEKELSCKLITRSTRSVEPTRAGLVFKRHAVKMLKEWEAMRSEMEEIGDGAKDAITLGYTTSEQLPFIQRGTRRKEWKDRRVELTLRKVHPAHIVEAVRRHEIDCAVMHRPTLGDARDLEQKVLGEPEIQVMIQRRSPLCASGALTLEQVSSLTDVRCHASRDPLYYAAIDEMFLRAGLNPPATLEAQESEELAILANDPKCVSLCPSMYPVWKGYVSLPIKGCQANFDFLFVYAADSAQSIISILGEALRKAMDL